MTAKRPIVLAAGGTGGHVFPAQALAGELLRRGRRVVLVTDARGVAFGDAVPGVEIRTISAGRVDGGPVRKMRGVFMLGVGLIQAGKALRGLSPGAVVGFGGYPSLPTMVAATRAGLPTLIHEQNAVLGRANRLVAKKVTRIATSFPTLGGYGGDPTRLVQTGNPVRDAVVAHRDTPYPDTADRLRILVIGGSQGARTLGRVVPEAISRLPDAVRRRLDVTQQCRDEDQDHARTIYADCGANVDVAAFFGDLPERLARAHLAVTRSGASTVAELTCVGRPAILVPYPHATDDHQTANARAIETAGAAWIVADAEMEADSLSQRLASLLSSPKTLGTAAAAAHRLGRPDAARSLADEVEALAGAGHNGDLDPAREEAA